MTRIRVLTGILFFSALIVVGQGTASAASMLYVHPNPGDCDGFSPCYGDLKQALWAAADGDSIVVLADMTTSIDDYYGAFTAKNLTIRGATSAGVNLNGNVKVNQAPVNGWTIKDLFFDKGVQITNVSGGLTLDHIKATGITLGSFTQDTTADIVVKDSILPNDEAAVISILGSPGYDIIGSIQIRNNTGVDAVNIWTYVKSGDPANLNASIAIDGNTLRRGANVGVNSLGESGTGNVTGSVTFTNNTMGDKIGITINGAASGDVTGPVTFSGNTGLWLALLTWDSTVGGSITGGVTVTDNDVEFIEIIAKGTLSGTILVDANHVIDKAGGVAQGPTIQAEGAPMAANVTVSGTTGNVAYVSVRSRSGQLSGAVKALDNLVGWIEIDSQGGSITALMDLSRNQLPTNPLPGSPLGAYSYISVRTLAGGNLQGGTIAGSAMDRLQFDLDGTLTGAMTISGNRFRDYASLMLKGARPSPALLTLTGNDVLKTTYLDGFSIAAHFNRHLGNMTVVSGSSVAAENNWWGCNTGPGTTGCSAKPASPTTYSPWLTFNSVGTCTGTGSASVSFGVQNNSSGGTPAGNITPGSVTIATSIGTVSQTPVSLVNGGGSTTVTFAPGASPVITTTLDAKVVTSSLTCVTERDTIGTMRPSTSRIYLKNQNSTGYANVTFSYGVPTDLFFVGDWDNNGTDTIGNFRNGIFYLRNSNSTGYADVTFGYGLPGDLPISGDWNNDGVDTVGVFRNGVFYLRNSNTSGYADITFGYGIPGDTPIAGDWNNDGVDTVGVFRNGAFYLRNSNTSGYADVTFGYGVPGDLPVSGDWNDDGVDTVGVFRNGIFYLRNSNTTGYANLTFGYGLPGDRPLAGDWDALP